MRLSRIARILVSAVPALVVLAFGLLAHSAHQRSLASSAGIERGHRITAELTGLLSRLKDAETAQRGFVLTGDVAYLEPYSGVRTDAAQAISALRGLVESPAQRAQLDSLRPRIERRLAYVEQVIGLRRALGQAAAEAAVRSGEGKAVMDDIRRRVTRIEHTHRSLLAQRSATQMRVSRRTTGFLIGGTLLCVALALAVNLVLSRYGAEQARAARELEEKNHLLEEQAIELELQGESLQAHAAELEEVNAALQGSQERFRALIENASDVITILAPDGGIRYGSPSLERILGYTSEEMVGRNALEFIHPEDSPSVAATLQELAREPGVLRAAEFRFRHKNGSWITLESSGRNLLADAAVGGIVVNSRDVTERRQAQEKERALALGQAARAEAEHAEARIRDVLESVTDAFFTLDREWRFTLLNRAAERLLGAGRDDLLGQKIWEALPQAVGSPLYETAQRTLRERIPIDLDAPSLLSPGTWFHFHLYPTREGIAIYAQDITGQRRLYGTLAQSEEAIRAMYGITSARDLSFDEKVRRLLAMGCERFGLPGGLLSHVEGDRFAVEVATPTSSMRPGEVFALQDLFCSAALVAEDPVSFAHAGASDWKTYPCYAEYPVEAYLGTSVVVAGRPYGTLCFTGPDPRTTEFTDADRDFLRLMAQWIGGEIERLHGEERLLAAKEQAEKANQAKSDFLSRMSHELRTPLNAILGFGQLLEMEESDPDTAESVEQILKAGRHLLALIDEVLDLSRIEAGRMSLSVEPVPVGEVVRDSLHLVRHMAAQHEVTLHAEAAMTTPYTVTADVQRLKQVLLNLVTNAIKYNRRGGTVTLSCEAVAEERLRIMVRDTGFGIPSARLEQLFTPFERLGAEGSTVQGTGLGLALSKGLVEAMGGRLEVESTEGEGSAFWVELPKAAAEEAPSCEGEGEGAPAPADVDTRLVLAVEDNPSNVRLLRRIFARRADLRLEVAIQGSLGLQLARECRPDLILLDLNLPDMPGDQVLQRLRQDPVLRDVPVVMLSGDAMPGSIQRLRELGVRDYITKPFDIGAFIRILDEQLPTCSP